MKRFRVLMLRAFLVGTLWMFVPSANVLFAVVPRPVSKIQLVLKDANSSDKEIARALDELAALRSSESCALMIAYLHNEESSLPTVLPDIETMIALERSLKDVPPPKEHWVYHLQHTLATIRRLVEIDMPDADMTVDVFMRRWKQVYGNSEVGTKLLKVCQEKIDSAKADVKTGAVPWKSGLSELNSE